MIETVLPLLVAAGLVVAMGLDWSSRPRSRAWRALRRTRNVPIAEIEDGAPARITGAVSAIGTTMRSPIDERACIGFRLEVEGLGRHRPIVLRREECVPFAIADESGKATVDGPILLGLDWENDWSMLPERCYGLLEAAGVVTNGLFFRRQFAFRQALLESGDRVSACGIAFLEPDPTEPAVGMRAPALRPHLRGTRSERVAVGDAARVHKAA